MTMNTTDSTGPAQDLDSLKRELMLLRLKRSAAPQTNASSAIGRAERGGPLPLSLAQQRLWFLDQLGEGASAAYHIPVALRLSGRLDLAALQATLARIVARHEALRTTFPSTDGVPRQHIEAADGAFALPQRDLRQLDGAAQQRMVQQIAGEEAARPFDLARGPLIRGQLLVLAEQEQVLLLTQHHIISDGWSIGVLVQEVGALYRAFSQGLPDDLPALALQYADYVGWQRAWLTEERLRAQADYWRGHLAGAPALLELPSDRVRPAQQSFAGGRVPLRLPAALAGGLRSLSQRHGATLFMTLLAAWGALLSRLSGQDQVVVGTPVAGRQRAELEPLIGLFVNTLALRVSLDPDATVASLLAHTKASALGAYANQELAFEQVVEALRPERSTSHSPLFQTLLTLDNLHGDNALDLPGLTLAPLELEHRSTQFDLSLALRDDGVQLEGYLEYADALFERATVERFGGYLLNLLEAMCADDHARIDALLLLGQEEQQRLLVDWNQSAVAFPLEHSYAEHFARRVAAHPERTAAQCGAEQISYRELDERSTRLAHALAAAGAAPNVVVVLAAERGLPMLAMMLAVLKSGAAFLPLDLNQPPARLAGVIGLSGAPLVLAAQDSLPLVASLLQAGAPGARLLVAERLWHGEVEAVALPRPAPGDLAYVIYTSGSTGTPKGAQVEQRGLLNHLFGKIAVLAMTEHDRLAQTASPAFDICVWQFLTALLAGGVTVILDDQVAGDPQAMLAQAAAQQVSLLQMVPSMLRSVLDNDAAQPGASLRWLLLIGEALPASTARDWFARQPRVPLMNFYGPAECADVVSFHALHDGAADGRTVPIGRPMPNTALYLLDRHGQPVPQGVAGELCVAGHGVGRGYLHNPEQTARAFVAHPFQPGARMYRTGDLARHRPDGTLEFVGRIDFQVKIRGFRIELGEIEARLAGMAGVQQVVVTARPDAQGSPRLVAYLVAAAGAEIERAALRQQLREALPDYMVPSAFVVLPGLPLTPNGKLDRKALPAPDLDAVLSSVYAAPEGALETALAAIWAELLDLPRVGRHDNFFELGGHSLLVARVGARVRQVFGVEVTLHELFAAPTLAGYAGVVAGASLSQAGPMPPADRNAPLALSFAQQRVWFLDQLDPAAGAAYNMPLSLRLDGELDIAALQAALNEVVSRHEVLRTRFDMGDQGPVQVIAPHLPLTLEVTDLGGLEAPAREAHALALANAEAQRPFDLARGPLLRQRLLRLAPQQHMVLMTMHHIVSDGWSSAILVREIGQLYAAFRAGQPSPLAPLPVQYADYAQWQRAWLSGERLERQLAYWRTELDGAPPLLTLPTDRPRPAVQDYRGATHAFQLPASLGAGLNALAQQGGATLFMVLNAAFSLLLSRYAGQDQVCVGTAIANRSRSEIEQLIGFFANTLVLRTRLDPDEAFVDLLQRVRATTLAAYEHQELPFEQVVEALNPERNSGYPPLMQVMLILQNMPASALELPGLTLQPVHDELGATKFDLRLGLVEEDGVLHGALQYSTALFDAATVARLARHFGNLLAAIVAAPRAAVGTLRLQDPEERAAILADWARWQPDWADPARAAPAAGPAPTPVLDAIERAVQRAPQACAIAWRGQRLSYGELARRSNQVARGLLAQGLRPGQVCAIVLEDPVWQAVASVGILKAGGVYASLNPDYPLARLHTLCELLAPACIVGEAALAPLLAALCAGRAAHPALLMVDPGGAAPLAADGVALASVQVAEQDDAACRVATGADDPCYVYFTSGSTGVPKPVLGRNAGLAHFIAWEIGALALGPDARLSHLTSPSFHVYMREVFTALCAGAMLCIPDSAEVFEPAALAAWLERDGVTLMHCVPSVLGLLLEQPLAERLPALRQIVVGGGAILPPAAQRIWEAFGARVELIGVYGQTETTLAKLVHRVPPGPVHDACVPLGRPLPGARAIVLSDGFEPCAVGEVGELYIDTRYRSLGYLNRPELNHAAFIAHPFAEGEVLYRTGDLALLQDDGNLRYMGRKDFQVKVRGMRVEPGEVEAALLALPGVSQAAVLARADSGGEHRLVAYVALRADAPAADGAALRQALEQRLPGHMVPAQFVLVERLPLTSNGKLDREALPAPDSPRAGVAHVAPRTPLEQQMAAIWRAVLGLEQVGVEDSFFDLGGHSLSATRVVSQMRAELGIELPLRVFFDAPTIAQLAAWSDYGRWLAATPAAEQADGGVYETEEF